MIDLQSLILLEFLLFASFFQPGLASFFQDNQIQSCPVDDTWYVQINNGAWTRLHQDIDLYEIGNLPLEFTKPFVMNIQLLKYKKDTWMTSHSAGVRAMFGDRQIYMPEEDDAIKLKRPLGSRILNSMASIPSPMRAGYKFRAKKWSQFLDIDFKCGPNDLLKGYIYLYQFRLVYADISPFVAIKSSVEFLVDGQSIRSSDFVVEVREKLNPVHKSKSVDGVPVYCRFNPNFFTPKLPDKNERFLDVSRDALFLNPEHNLHMQSEWDLREYPYLSLEFHQFHHFAPLFKQIQSVMINLNKVSEENFEEANSEYLVTIPDYLAYSCEHDNEGHCSREFNEFFSGNSRYSWDSSPPKNCENLKGCYRISSHYEITVIVMRHNRKTDKSWTGYPAFNLVTGEVYSYRIWIKPRKHLESGLYYFEISSKWTWTSLNDMHRPDKPSGFMEPFNSWREIKSNTGVFLVKSTDYIPCFPTEDYSMRYGLDDRGRSSYDRLELARHVPLPDEDGDIFYDASSNSDDEMENNIYEENQPPEFKPLLPKMSKMEKDMLDKAMRTPLPKENEDLNEQVANEGILGKWLLPNIWA